MASLDKLKSMKDTEIQSWLRKVDHVGAGILAKALVGAPEPVTERVFRNLSDTAGAALKVLVDEAAGQGISKAEIEYQTKRLELLF